jgi:phosphohistidine swiveling domain-containing protein
MTESFVDASRLTASDAELLDPAAVGHKFARLQSMLHAGFPVPPLFCLPASVFDDAVRESAGGSVRGRIGAPPDPRDAPAVRAWSRAARELTTDVPSAVAAAALAAFDDLVGPDGLAAVRACVVGAPGGNDGEDSAADPFAGLSESFLYVRRERLVERIAGCWASAFRPEAVLYRLRRGGDPAAARVAVGVQRMVPATRSFVAFTRDPRDGRRELVVAAAHGIGEGVVQERADIDHFFVDPARGTVRTEAVRKTLMLGAPAPGQHGPVTLPVPDALADVPVLDAVQLKQIADTAQLIERHFAAPQDIEGAFTPDGRLHIVQSRPLVPPPSEPAGGILWTNHNITESYPGVSSAMTYSIAQQFYRRGFADLYRQMGVPEPRLRANRHHLDRMIGRIDGRVFYRVDAWYALHGMLPAFPLLRGWWEHGMGLGAEARPAASRPPGLISTLRIAPDLLLRAARHPRDVREFLHWWDSTAAGAARLEDRGSDQLVELYHWLWTQVAARWGVTLVNTILSGCAITALDALFARWAGGEDRALMFGLFAGGPENRSLAGLRSGLRLAQRLGANPRLRERVLADTGPQAARVLWDEIVDGEWGRPLAREAAEHLRRYGDRAPGDLKLEVLTPRQDPCMVLDMVRPLVEQRATVSAGRRAERTTREDAEARLRERCPDPLRRLVLRALAAIVRQFVKVREDTRYCRTELFGISRRIVLRLGADLTDAGHLDDPRDVMDLTIDELLGAFEGTVPPAELRPRAAERRRDREADEARPAPPSRLYTDPAAGAPWRPAPPISTLHQPADAADVLRGLPSSRGLVRARARVVLDPEADPESCRDAILVARETDPGWLFLMTAARGLVVERGTLLSHTAITGRLLGVPTVVSVPGATTRIPDGAWIELDGSAGTVRILEAEPQ